MGKIKQDDIADGDQREVKRESDHHDSLFEEVITKQSPKDKETPRHMKIGKSIQVERTACAKALRWVQ